MQTTIQRKVEVLCKNNLNLLETNELKNIIKYWQQDIDRLEKEIKQNTTKYEIYTDGSCKGNGLKFNKGGYGYVAFANNLFSHKDIFFENNTTNNRMELKGFILALKWLKTENKSATIYTDSKYVCEGYNSWCENWAKKQFKDVKNPELWKELYSLKKELFSQIEVKWVKGHNKNYGNELIDSLIKIH